MSLIIRIIVNMAALWAATLIVSGVEIEFASTTEQVFTLLVVAVIFAVVNVIVKPIVQILSLPLFVLTLGLFTFVVNALMLMLTSWLAGVLNQPFHVDGFFWSAVLGALVISIVSWALNLLLPN